MIEYAGEAYEAFQRHVAAIAGYTVRLTIGDETLDATLLGPDLDAEDGFTVRYREQGAGPETSAVAERIYVY